jgi:hypothetical protein
MTSSSSSMPASATPGSQAGTMGSMGATREPTALMDELDATVATACTGADNVRDHAADPCVRAYLARAGGLKADGDLLGAFQDMKRAKAIGDNYPSFRTEL